MKTFVSALMLSCIAMATPIEPELVLINYDKEEKELLDEGVITPEDIVENPLEASSEIHFLPEPLAKTAAEAKKPPGKWTDEQKLTLETFKEIVATDVENVWVVAYIDPRCRDCLILSLEWEKLT